jgi:hypothetical protein
MKRWLLIAAAAILTLGGLAWFEAPAMAREYHPRHVHAARRDAFIRHAAHVRAHYARAPHFRAPLHAARRR